jgi:hypothetical protein
MVFKTALLLRIATHFFGARQDKQFSSSFVVHRKHSGFTLT